MHPSAETSATTTAAPLFAAADNEMAQLTAQLKSSTEALRAAVSDTAQHTQAQAEQLFARLKQDIDSLTSEESLSRLANHWSARAHQLKQQSADTVQTHPLGSVLVAAGAGLLIGYLLATQHDDE